MIPVSNTTPLIALSRVGRLGLLAALFSTVVVPEAVAREFSSPGDPDPPAWLAVRPAPVLEPTPGLGAGEREALALARELTALLLTDDLAARRWAGQLSVPVRGTLGLLAEAKRAGLLERVGPVVAELGQAGLRLSPALVRAFLATVNEGEGQ